MAKRKKTYAKRYYTPRNLSTIVNDINEHVSNYDVEIKSMSNIVTLDNGSFECIVIYEKNG